MTMTGCANTINDMTVQYVETAKAVKHFAHVSAKDWLFGSGIIQGALPTAALPAWVIEELKKVDAWAEKGKLTEYQYGYMMGVRIRLASPIIKVAIEQYAPGILNISEVGKVISFMALM